MVRSGFFLHRVVVGLLLLVVSFFSSAAPAVAAPPPPLPRTCVGGGTPIVAEICCLSGYVYLNGQPFAGASLTILAHGQRAQIETAVQDQRPLPYYYLDLSVADWIKPGDLVTVTAQVGAITQRKQFIAQPQGQQVDFVMPAGAVEGSWHFAPDSIAGRSGAALSYDALRQQVVLFGGKGHSQLFDDTWEWHAQSGWRYRATVLAPSARAGHSLLYAANQYQSLLFGGQSAEGYLNDLWRWDGSLWQSVAKTAPWPAPRSDQAMSYDSARQQVLLFGGADADGAFGDTWLWDGRQWSMPSLASAPPKRSHHAMAYDPRRQQLLLFGGQGESQTANATATVTLGDTWVWHGSSWQQLTPAIAPPPLARHRMAYDPQRQAIILWGGEGEDGSPTDTLWLWNGSTWRQQLAPGPTARVDHTLVTVPEGVLLFGGRWRDGFSTVIYGDTWRRQADRWQLLTVPPPFAQLHHSAMAYENDGAFLFFGGAYGSGLQATPRNESFRWSLAGTQPLTVTQVPPARSRHRLVRNQDGSLLLLFGGLGTEQTSRDDTWLWNGSDWRAPTLTSHPSARLDYSLAYDTTQARWLLFGGRTKIEQGVDLNDLWAFDGSTWQEIKVATNQPAPRHAATVTYDPQRARLVLFGGKNNNGLLRDLWEWQDGAWQEVTPAASQPAPSARAGHTAYYDARLGGLLVLGGEGGLQDSWLWNGSAWRAITTAPTLPVLANLQSDYDLRNQQLVVYGERAADGLAAEGAFLTYQSQQPSSETKPIATIHYLYPRDNLQRADVIRFVGLGSNATGDDTMRAYAWRINGRLLSNQQAFTYPVSALPGGDQTITFAVQDPGGQWSETAERTIIIPPDETSATTAFLPFAAR